MAYERVAVLGASGQLGRALVSELGTAAIPLQKAQADFLQPGKLLAVLSELKPDAIINSAAYTDVESAEAEEGLATLINAETPQAIANYCREKAVPLIHYSTDYVFDGSGNLPWVESDAAAPLNAYGRSKLKGENAILRSGAPSLIFRTSWIYSATGKNFFTAMLRLAKEKETLTIVDDQIGAPTYAPHLAKATVEILRIKGLAPSGVYHLCNHGQTSWHGFAKTIFTEATARGMPLMLSSLLPVTSAEYPVQAIRPLNSRLDCAKARTILGVALPSWQQGVSDCFTALNARS